MNKIEPLNDFIVAVKVELETKTASGLFLPTDSQERKNIAKVISVPKDIEDIVKGEEVVYTGYPVDIKLGDTEYILIKYENILAKINY